MEKHSESLSKQFKEDVAIHGLERGFESMESTAMDVLVDLVQQAALEFGTEIKKYSEAGMRAQPNLIDALNAAVEFEFPKEEQIKAIDNTACCQIHRGPSEFDEVQTHLQKQFELSKRRL